MLSNKDKNSYLSNITRLGIEKQVQEHTLPTNQKAWESNKGDRDGGVPGGVLV